MSELKLKLSCPKPIPDGLSEALRDLGRVLADSPHSYSIHVFRYQGSDSYQARIEINDLVVVSEFGND